MRAFLVEGQMEKKIVERLCPGVTVRLIGANGDDVAISVLAKFISAQLETLLNRYYPITVVFDRERRQETCEEIKTELLRCLAESGHCTQQVDVVVADRTTESWFLPFLQDDGTLNPDERFRPDGEGLDAKGRVKSIFRSLRKSYVETVDGVRLFCNLNPHIVKLNSPSFASLIAALQTECAWAYEGYPDSNEIEAE